MRNADSRDSLDALLGHDLHWLGHSLGFASAEPHDLSEGVVLPLLQRAERLSRRAATSSERHECLSICALLWEHRRSEWSGLPAVLVQLLHRLDFSPASYMVDRIALETHVLPSLGSLRSETAATARMLLHEVPFRRSAERLLLSGFQKRLWDLVTAHARVGVSAPTSAGKSFVLVNKVIDALVDGGIAIYVVPTISLIHQVTSDIRALAKRYAVEGLVVSQTVSNAPTDAHSHVFVLTQERALAALGHDRTFGAAKIAVIDEIQNIERVSHSSDERAHTLYDVIRLLVDERKPEKIVISGPRIKNISSLSEHLLGAGSHSIDDDLPPVLNVTYSFAKRGRKHLLRQHSVLRSEPLEIALDAFPSDLKVTGQQYKSKLNAFISGIVDRLGDQRDGGTLVFSPTSPQATRTAADISRTRSVPEEPDARLSSLSDYLKQSVHPRYELAQCVLARVGYHHGKMPNHARLCIERAFRAGLLDVVACTTTLMQGVNLPARTLIARNPDLFIKGKEPKPRLTSYEFSNLRGRAGRLMKDFVGRALVLDEEAFSQQEIELAAAPDKTVTAGFQERFDEAREEIVSTLTSGEAVTDDVLSPDLVVYVRSALLRHGADAIRRLRRTGIVLTTRDVELARDSLGKLKVPREVCLQLPYWDPVVVDRLYQAQVLGKIPALPSSPFIPGFTQRLARILQEIRSASEFYFAKYFGISHVGFLQAILIGAQKWATEKPLPDIIGGDNLDSEKIDQRIATLSRHVSHDLPKILRPIALLQAPENPLLSFIEMGAYSPAARRLMELGLPREPVVSIVREGWPQSSTDDLRESALIATLRRRLNDLHPWEKEQVVDVLPTLSDSRIALPA